MRIVIAIIFFIPSYPFLFLAMSVFGMVTIIGLIGGIIGLLSFFSNNQQWKDDTKEFWEMTFMPFAYPFAEWYNYIQEGKFMLI